MIKSFRHKGLETFFKTGNAKGIRHNHSKKLRNILARLDAATEVNDKRYSGSNLHQLQGKLKGIFAVTVNGNWRVIFKFKNDNAELVDYLDYH